MDVILLKCQKNKMVVSVDRKISPCCFSGGFSSFILCREDVGFYSSKLSMVDVSKYFIFHLNEI